MTMTICRVSGLLLALVLPGLQALAQAGSVVTWGPVPEPNSGYGN